jgi:hypothetical protein
MDDSLPGRWECGPRASPPPLDDFDDLVPLPDRSRDASPEVTAWLL